MASSMGIYVRILSPVVLSSRHQTPGLLISQGSWVRYPVWQHTFVSPSSFSRRAVVSYWRKYVHKVLVNRLGGLSLPRKSVVRLTDRPDMTLDVYRGRKTTIQQQYNNIDVRLLADCYSLLCTKDLASNYGVDVKILLTLDS